MGLIKAALASAGGVLGDQWKEYFYCDALPETVLAVRGKKKVSSRSSNKGNDNVITNGSVIAVADGQCMLIVDQGKVAEICAEPGEFVYDASTEPSVFSGALGQSVKDTFAAMGRRFTFGGDVAKDQRVYYINTKELFGNKYGTPTPVPFRVVDEDIGFRTQISIRCFGEYSYRICDPILFYKNVCSNITDEFVRDRLDSMLKSELMTALQPAFGKMSAMGISYTELPLHTMDIANALNEVLSEQWRKKRGLEVVSFGVSSVSATEEDEKRLKDMQQSVFLGGGNAAAGRMVDATANAMEAAAKNTATGPMMAFAGMNMAGSAGTGNMQGLFQQNVGAAYQTPASKTPEPAAEGWTCPSCGTKASGNFCPECGAKKPEAGWKCSCGTVNQGKFCSNCGAKRPAAEPNYKCSKCGWEPEDPKHPPKFCPECGNRFTDADIIS
ncbi:MAG: SPFH domain-containing protein [Candidatus Faecousia sp.]|nr:SPFH domain-containing protein [Candidatus Faecousia sp.]